MIARGSSKYNGTFKVKICLADGHHIQNSALLSNKEQRFSNWSQ